MWQLSCVLVLSLYYYSTCQDQGPAFNAGVGYMFRHLAVNILNELRGKNVSVHGELLTKISFLKGGMKQLLAVAENDSPAVFDTIKPIVKDIMEKGKPEFEKIKFADEDLVERFAWNSTQVAQFHDLHNEVAGMLKRLNEICLKNNYCIID